MRITVFAILAVHVVLLGVLLIAGCNKKGTGTEVADGSVPPVPSQPDNWPGGANAQNTPPTTSPQTPDAQIPPVPPPTVTTLAPTDNVVTPVTPATPTGVVTPAGQDNPPAIVHEGGVTEHVVLKGETLATIGKKYGVGYKAIEAANPGINATRLKIGQKIQVPAKTAAPTAAAPVTNGSGSGTIYIVKSGDNLLKISKATGVSVKQLRAANNLKYDQIRVGQKLKIPAHNAPTDTATVPPVPAPQ